ncbi:DUF2292 domain-containing protein [Tolypothrix campylonemoides VB511288]|nr:DUF2292 domain-containing protein [Tolypothrix campylonemoides VB511288]
MTDLRPVPPPAADAALRAAVPPLSDAERTVLAALRELQYGALEVVVHSAHIVQVARRQTLRIDGG